MTADVSQGGMFETNRTRMEVGSASEPPEINERTGEVNADVLDQVSVEEGHWSSLELELGEYWLWWSNHGEVTTQACAVGTVFNAVPATPPSEPAK